MISIVIPVIDEAANLRRLLPALAAEPEPHETIVVDGASADDSREVARACGAVVLEAPPSRGGQIAKGAAAARGETLWFLHADTMPAPGALTALARALDAAPDAPGGNFRLLFDGARDFDRWLDGFYAKLRARGVYYGDSGVFVRAAVYRALGGMPELALMEDFAFVRKLERAGPTLCLAEPPLRTSSRRFEGRTKARIVAGWLAIHAFYALGVDTRTLARLYGSDRRTACAKS
ncbi:MAG: glycosyltransferase family 2 protein [Tagaea sp.]|nr:glycosyltransferase family 2 protein [Tagaea sp.]